MFSQLSDKLQDIFKELRGHGTISESNIDVSPERQAGRRALRKLSSRYARVKLPLESKMRISLE
jgi:hypothetical protein